MVERIIILKQESVNALRNSIADNISRYESSNPDWASILDTNYARETRVEINGSISDCFASEDFQTMKNKEDIMKNEVKRCITVYETLKNLTPQQATDERVWTYLTHFTFWDYARIRWTPLPKDHDKKIQSIKSHFFLSGVRGMVRDNSISRLWWMAYVCDRVKNCSLEKALNALLYMEDVRKEIMERATFCRSEPILNALMKALVKSHESTDKKLHDRETFRQLSKQLNRIGGKLVLDSLKQTNLDTLVESIIKDILAEKE